MYPNCHRITSQKNVYTRQGVATAPGVALANSASPVDKDLLKSSSFWLISILVAEMPFAKNPRGVTCGLEHFSNRHRL